MRLKYAEEPFNMGMFFYLKRHSKWVHFQTPITHIQAFLYWSHSPHIQHKVVSSDGGALVTVNRAVIGLAEPLFFPCNELVMNMG